MPAVPTTLVDMLVMYFHLVWQALETGAIIEAIIERETAVPGSICSLIEARPFVRENLVNRAATQPGSYRERTAIQLPPLLLNNWNIPD